MKAIYFIGAGGIGMSALERYYNQHATPVAGYDRTPSALTDALIREGIDIHFDDDPQLIPEAFRDPAETVVCYTPAIPADHRELAWFRERGFKVIKRAELLGDVTRQSQALCFAGTHGKTTTSAMCAHILNTSAKGCNAFLGGILKNIHSNYILNQKSEFSVIEADEFDRSFHHLTPYMSVVTATDPDHLDIYGTEEAYLESFRHYTSLIRPDGALIIHTGLKMKPDLQAGARLFTYSRDEGDFHAANIVIDNGEITFDLVSPIAPVTGIQLGQPVPINIENAVAAMAMAQLAGVSPVELRTAMASYAGVERRFDYRLRTPRHVVLSDYAHHPKEILQSARSLRELYPGRRLTAIFQPHLYTRTRDFHPDFAAALSHFDQVVLTEIYPAREAPIPGVTSEIIYNLLTPGVEKEIIRKADATRWAATHPTDVLVILGAGDLDLQTDDIAAAANR